MKRYLVIVSLLFLFSIGTNAVGAVDYVRFGVPNKIGQLDPIKSTNYHTRELISLVYQNLVGLNAEQEIEPIIAKSWTFDIKKRNLVTIELKKGIRFSDGSLLTAVDISNSLARACAPESEESYNLQGLKGCKERHLGSITSVGIKIIDDYTVRFEIVGHPTLFLYQLSTYAAQITKFRGQQLLGSGPYFFSDVSPDKAVLKKNPYYTGKIANDGVIIDYVTESQLGTKLKAGKLDGAIVYQANDFPNELNEYRLFDDKSSLTLALALNSQVFPFNKSIVRKALMAEIYNTGAFERCTPNVKKAYGLIPLGISGSIAHRANNKLPEVTPEEVFKEVPELLHKKKIVIHRHMGRHNACEENILISSAKKFNIDIKIKLHDSYETLWPLYLNNSIDGFLELFVFYKNDAFTQLRKYLSTSELNPANVRSKKLDSMIDGIWSAANSSVRYDGYRKVNTFLQEEALVIPLHYSNHRSALRKCIEGAGSLFELSPFQGLPDLHFATPCKMKKGNDYAN